jgi:hypothetical protein
MGISPDILRRHIAQGGSCPGGMRENGSAIMSTPIAHVLATVASLATVYPVAGTSGNARADDLGAVRHAPAELAQWQSSLIDASDSHVKPEWKSALGAIDSRESAESRAAAGAVGLRNASRYGIRYSPDIPETGKGARASTRDPAGMRSGNGEISR